MQQDYNCSGFLGIVEGNCFLVEDGNFWESNLKSKFWARSIHLDPVGFLTLKFDDGEVFQWSKVTTFVFYQSLITKTWTVPFQEIINMDDGIYEAVAGSDFVITRVRF
ncbi:uncharacterized protein LOC131220217 [Magnolia sinica]|uniref:uncharacterized protein LOC131220217 n=1 Tax=Magnolia sinica TaxID=86752 RepID=UPI00265B0C92|nr:uncharacterized protein LOC131220217 [Magnolia sinica]